MHPIERAVFLLREAFDYDYDEIAQMVGKSPTNCQRIFRRFSCGNATRTRQHITEQRPRFQVDQQQQEQITVKFLEATNQGNLEDLLSLLSKDVTYWSDGGGQVAAALKPLHGAMKVARFLLALYSKRLNTAISDLIEVNGQPGVMVIMGDRIQSVTTFDILDGSIQSIYTMRNPEKLKRISLGDSRITQSGD